MPTFNLWHLFPLSEERKLRTFLHGGLWCSELNSIVNFQNDVEGTQAYGTFVSCWHKSEGDPTALAWTIFGGDGDGIAIRGSSSYLHSLADTVDHDWLKGVFGEVRYLASVEPVTDAAFEVRSSHQSEAEMRVALRICDIGSHDDALRRSHVRARCPIRQSDRNITHNIKDLTLIEDEMGEDALVLPIDSRELFQEVVFGAKVSAIKRESLQRLIKDAGIDCPFRALSQAA
jgi:hypothetical protein